MSTPSERVFRITVQAAASAPSWLSGMALKTWYQIAGASPDLGLSATNLGAAFNDDGTGKPYQGSTGFNSLWDTWNGSVYVPTVGTHGSLMLWGGGHRDFYGNGMLRFDLETRTFSMYTPHSLAGPFASFAALTNGAYTDGTPSPPHTYQAVQYHPVTDSFACLKSITNINAPDTGSASVPLPWLMNVQSKAWRYGSQASSFNTSSDGSSCYDSIRGVFWVLEHNVPRLGRFVPSASGNGGGSWSVTSAGQPFLPGQSIGHDPVTDRLVVVDSGQGTARSYSAASPSAAPVSVTMSGTPALTQKSPLEWNSVLGGFVYHRSGTGDLHLLTTANNWANGTWTNLGMNSNGKDFSVNNGIYSRSRTLVFGSTAVQIAACKESSGIYAARLN